MIRLILLLLFVLGLLVGSHLLIYRFLVRAFALRRPRVRRIVLCGLLVLSLSFPIALPLAKSYPSFVTASFFIVAAWWMALAINLLVFAAAASLLQEAARRVWRPFASRATSVAALLLAVVVTAYGVWQAQYPQVHHLEVTLEHLPPSWDGRTIIQLSDLHLGHLQGSRFMRRVARAVNSLKPDLIVITGDLFDGPGGDFLSFVGAIDTLRASRGVLLVHGNHEVYSQAGPALEVTNLRVLHDEVVDLAGLQIAGVGYPGLPDRQALARFRDALDPRQPSILLFHTPTDILQRGNDRASSHFATYWMPDTRCSLNRQLGIDLQLSGHTHAGQIFPFGFLAQLIYQGRDQGLHRDGSFQLYVSSGTGTFGPPIRTAGRSEIVVITLRAKR